MATTVADVMVATLKASGARRVWGIPGDFPYRPFLPDGVPVTLRQQRLPVKIVVFNNGALSFVELEMKAAGIVNYGTDLDNPDFAAIARATGLFGVRVDKAAELPDALHPVRDQDDPVRRGEELVELAKSNLRELEVE